MFLRDFFQYKKTNSYLNAALVIFISKNNLKPCLLFLIYYIITRYTGYTSIKSFYYILPDYVSTNITRLLIPFTFSKTQRSYFFLLFISKFHLKKCKSSTFPLSDRYPLIYLCTFVCCKPG